jgi:plastocyanin
MKRLSIAACFAVLLAQIVAADAPKEHQVTQKGKQFAVGALKAKVGEQVTFKNDDDVSHNIFSLSDVQTFDLGVFGTGQTRSLVLEAPGVIEVECAVHPNMKMQITVSK